MLLRGRRHGQAADSEAPDDGHLKAHQQAPPGPAPGPGSACLGAAGWVAASVLSLLLLLTLLSPGDAPAGRLRPAAGGTRRTLGSIAGSAPAPQLNPAAVQHGDVAEACSAEFRQRNAAAVQNGSDPAVVQWGCDIQECAGALVQRLVESYRQRQLTDFLEFVPCDLYKAIQGRTLWIVGDSQQQYFYRQLRCFLAPFLEKGPAPRRDANITSDPHQLQLISERVLRGYCCGVAVPICTHLVGGTRLCHVRVNKGQHLVEDVLPNLVGVLNASTADVLVVNFGLWHHIREGDYPGLVQRFADYYAANRTRLPVTIWRDSSPQHFDIANGEFPHPSEAEGVLGPGPKKCVPIQGALLLRDGTLWGHNEHVKAGGWRNIVSSPLLLPHGIPTLASWSETVPLWDMHTPGECSHWCAPGGYSLWVWQLWTLLGGLPLPPVQQRPGGRVSRAEY